MRADTPVSVPDPQPLKEVESRVKITHSESDMIRPLDWNGYDAACALILLFFAAFTRFWIIQYPRHYVYQEDRYITYINSYLNGSYFVDSQPPLATMLAAGVAYLMPYEQVYKPPSLESNFTYPTMDYVSLRSTTAYLGIPVVPLIYFAIRAFGGSRLVALLGGVSVLCDFILIATERHIFVDGFVHLFVAFFLFTTAMLTRFVPHSISWKLLLGLQSISLGCSMASSFSTFPLLFFALIFHFWKHRTAKPLAINAVVALVIFFGAYSAHVILLPYRSTLDGASPLMKDFLVDRTKPRVTNHSTILRRMKYSIKATFKVNRMMTPHPTKWYMWPFCVGRWTLLWTQLGRYVAAFPNIPVCLSVTFSVLMAITRMGIVRKVQQNSGILAIGYFLLLFFYVFGVSERGYCDYAIPLLFGIPCMCLWIDEELSQTLIGFVSTAIMASAVSLFVVWAPLVYGYHSFDMRFWPYFGSK